MTKRMRATPTTHTLHSNGLPGFTLVEVLIAAMIVAVLAMAALPTAGGRDADKARGAATILAADIQAARMLAMGNTLRACGIITAADGSGYHIARADSPALPIASPVTGEPMLVVFGEGRGRGLDGVVLAEAGLGGDGRVFFDAAGCSDQGTPATWKIRCRNHELTIAIDPTTGAVSVW